MSLCNSCVKLFNLCKLDLSNENVRECINYKPKNRSKLYCFIMNIIDFRYWFCDCKYLSHCGIVISSDCKKHD